MIIFGWYPFLVWTLEFGLSSFIVQLKHHSPRTIFVLDSSIINPEKQRPAESLIWRGFSFVDFRLFQKMVLYSE